ncbi:hypothetical protein [Mycobacterium sp. URHB0044]|uniref:hypothetical protein n=1 Tax=Mycobacterium sp. URHB0044 TaxID=1380386 RepID=UPI00048E62DB|nr:hypothetical protein [Mycobacterium sp. URHB0044]
MRRLVFGLLVVAALVTGCAESVDGAARPGSRDVDPASFFAGAVATYGQPVSSDDVDGLAYLRALRRIDPCGLLTHDDLVKIGEIGSVGTLFAFDECDVDVKVPGETDRRYVSVELTRTHVDGQPVVFRAAGLPVYDADPGSCDYLVPLELSRLPGAPPARGADRPFVRIGLIADGNCEFVQRLVQAVAPRLAALRVPLRDAVAVYPAEVAEHDPCHVLSALDGQVGYWDVEHSRPYECDFVLQRIGFDAAPLRVSLEPQSYDMATETRTRLDRDGVEVFVDQGSCTAATFVGPALRRKFVGGSSIPTGDVVIRPAVVVAAGPGRCDAAIDVAAASAKFYA